MRVSPNTLLALKNECKDTKAREAFKDFVLLSKYNDVPVVVAAYWNKNTDTINVGLIWDV